jgi:hypothetical protein
MRPKVITVVRPVYDLHVTPIHWNQRLGIGLPVEDEDEVRVAVQGVVDEEDEVCAGGGGFGVDVGYEGSVVL